MLLVQYGYDAESTIPDISHNDDARSSNLRGSLGSRSEAVEIAALDRRPDARLTQSYDQKSISFQQHNVAKSELPPGSLLKEQSVLIQNHVIGLCKKFMKWLDELDECVQESLELAIVSTADRTRLHMIEKYKVFLRQFNTEVAQMNKETKLPYSLPPTSHYNVPHMKFVLQKYSQIRKIIRGLRKMYLQVLWCDIFIACVVFLIIFLKM